MNNRKHLLLLGAGFSRNWGGWLASEVFEYLLGTEQIANDDEIVHRLWLSKIKGGGFEDALAHFQQELHRKNDRRSSELLNKLQSAIVAMFADMNAGFGRRDFNFSNFVDRSMARFIGRFDAVFTLNQDSLLELHYNFVQGPPPHKWSGKTLPGMIRVPAGSGSPLYDSWIPSNDLQIPKNSQPIFKLHGSANWRTSGGGELLIMGGNKSPAIQSNALLNWYQEKFTEHLRTPDARLMVIGYGFGDTHINEQLKSAAASGLRLFLIDPAGSDVVERSKWPPGAVGASGDPTPLERMIIGGSRRSLREIFSDDEVEFTKVLRFFSV